MNAQQDNTKAQSWAGLLWIVTLLVSVCLVLVNYVGWLGVITYGFASVLAIACWLRFSNGPDDRRSSLVPTYILNLVLFLLLAFFQYAANYHTFLFQKWQSLLAPNLTPDYTHWFVVFVCFPVSFLLVGGYFLAKKNVLGEFFLWWGNVYFLVQAILHLQIELGASVADPLWRYLGVLTAIGLFLSSAYGIMRFVKEKNRSEDAAVSPAVTTRQINRWSLLFICLVLVYAVTIYKQAGFLPVGIIVGSMMGGMMGWRKTTAHRPADPYKVVPLYLLLQGLFYIHVGEETLTNFSQAIADLSGHPWNEREFNFLIALAGPVIWVFAAWSLWKRQAFGNFILWFIIVGMILGEPTHVLVFPVVRMVQTGVRYQYFPGMYTALFPMIPAVSALLVILRDYRKATNTTA